MKTKLNKKTILGISLLVIIALASFSICYAATRWYTYHVNNYWSVDSGKHLDWDGSTQFMSNFTTGVNTWNNYKSGVIRQDTPLILEDITIGDAEYVTNNALGETRQKGPGKSSESSITFSTVVMNQHSTLMRNICCTHELGHALGLAHNSDTTDSVMYPGTATTCNNVLHTDDKLNYDYMYNNKY